ncbi:MAG: hypothetical protein JWP89_5733, partial [Schlesneria sp.]|nr:hypothetical protein [Schlesneria sp.]
MLLHKLGICAGIATAMLFTGCRSSQKTAASGYAPNCESPVQSFTEAEQRGAAIDESESLVTVSHETTELAPAVAAMEPDDPFAKDVQLQLELLVAMVKARNPSLQAANAAWSAAAERYPQAIAFDDPMMQTMFAPATFSS